MESVPPDDAFGTEVQQQLAEDVRWVVEAAREVEPRAAEFGVHVAGRADPDGVEAGEQPVDPSLCAHRLAAVVHTLDHAAERRDRGPADRCRDGRAGLPPPPRVRAGAARTRHSSAAADRADAYRDSRAPPQPSAIDVR